MPERPFPKRPLRKAANEKKPSIPLNYIIGLSVGSTVAGGLKTGTRLGGGDKGGNAPPNEKFAPLQIVQLPLTFLGEI